MPQNNEFNTNLLNNSSEIQEIMGHIPPKIIRIGISVIFCIISIIVIGSCFFKYPDVITGTITITTQNPPAPLTAKTSGKIQQLLISDTNSVYCGQTLAVLENTANYTDIRTLKSSLDNFRTDKEYLTNLSTQNYNLGELQNSYSSFSKTVKDYINFINLDYYNQKISSLYKQIVDYKGYFTKLNKQLVISTQQMELHRKQFKRDSLLFVKKVYSNAEYEKAEQQYLSNKYSYQGLISSIANTQMQMNQLQQQLLDLKLQQSEANSKQEVNLTESLSNLKSSIGNWEKTYLIISPINGKVSFTKFWSENQNVQMGEVVLTVLPNSATNIIGKIKTSSIGIGKVHTGQRVNIKLDNFPYMTYGLMRGTVTNISEIPETTPNGALYTAEVEIPDTLISNYGTKIKFSQEMTGQAEIITEDKRLIERFISPIIALWSKNMN